jgi:hypothetical protein
MAISSAASGGFFELLIRSLLVQSAWYPVSSMAWWNDGKIAGYFRAGEE